MKKSLISLLVGLSIGSSFAVNAADEERWFEVEVILFERNVEPAKVIEHWDQSLYPTYSKKNKDPMKLFIDNKNLITPSSKDNDQAFVSDTSTPGLQPTLIDDSETLPIFGAERTDFASNDADKNKDIIRATKVVIDGANLKSEVKDAALQIAPATDLQLAEQFTALNDHANYNVVLHSAWRMQPKERKDAIPIRLFAGQNYQPYYRQNGDAIVNTVVPAVSQPAATDSTDDVQGIANGSNVINLDNAATINDGIIVKTETVAVETISEQPTPPAKPTTPVWKIDGELTIYLEHYLYAKTNLFVRKEGSKVIPAEQIADAESLETEVTANVDDIDLLKLLGINLEPKQAVENEIELTTAEQGDAAVINDGLADSEVITAEFNSDGTFNDTLDAVETSETDETNDAEITEEDAINVQVQDKVVPFLNSYPMQQLRVIRSGEIHYLDHPMFGMLIQIRKYEPPVQEEINAEEAQ